jgi:hypothetical protein
MTTTNIATMQAADWDKLHDDVSERIQLIEQAIKKLEPNPLNDKIANELFMPALRLLADFCSRIEIERDPADPAHISMNVLAPESERGDRPDHSTIPLQDYLTDPAKDCCDEPRGLVGGPCDHCGETVQPEQP